MEWAYQIELSGLIETASTTNTPTYPEGIDTTWGKQLLII